MTVRQLKEKLSSLPDNMPIVFSRYQEEGEDGDAILTEIDGVEVLRALKDTEEISVVKVAVIFKR